MKTISAPAIHQSCDNLQLFLFNVGQGDHLLLKFPQNEYGIIDFYYDTAKSDMLEAPVLTYFKALKKNLPPEEFNAITISFLCISHTDKDHITGICETIEWFDQEGVFIKQIWLAAGKDESQLIEFLQRRFELVMDKQDLKDRFLCGNEFEDYKSYISSFFKSFKRWQSKEFKSPRYKTEYSGNGEYLVEIKLLMPPCTYPESEAVNIGPLTGQLTEYYEKLTYEIIQKIIGFKDKGVSLDRNLISHILKILYGEKVLIFGGDTDRKRWLECVTLYNNPHYRFSAKHGALSANFVKVSHHGSKNSTDEAIWKEILASDGKVLLGISAGRHLHYRHPHSETLSDIRGIRPEAEILSTNVCQSCLQHTKYAQEYHSWYGEMINSSRDKSDNIKKTIYDEEIDKMLEETNSSKTSPQHQYGLLAYIFDVPSSAGEDISVRVALTEAIPGYGCFFEGHAEKLCEFCPDGAN